MVCLDLVVCLNFEQENQGEKKKTVKRWTLGGAETMDSSKCDTCDN